MQVALNSEQARGLANFFFDVGKGLMLGGLGFATIVSFELKLISVSVTSLCALVCVRFALRLLEDIE